MFSWQNSVNWQRVNGVGQGRGPAPYNPVQIRLKLKLFRGGDPSEKATPNQKFIWTSFCLTISVGFLTHVTGEQAEARANFSKKLV